MKQNSLQPVVKYWSIVPAAGKGDRMGISTPKQYLPLHGKPIIEHSLNALFEYSQFEKIVVVINSDDNLWSTLPFHQHPKIIATVGGKERCHSVLNGLYALESLADPNDWILVHDAARPCLRATDIERLVGEVGDHPVGGLLGVPMTDTVKRVASNGYVIATIDRRELWQAYSPQLFRYAVLKDALKQAVNSNHLITDEASAIELSGAKSLMVEGRRDNIKITNPEDLILAASYLSN